MYAPRPTDRDTIRALRLVARALDVECAWHRRGVFYFPLSPRFSLAVSPDSAGRFRLSACYGTTETATVWTLAGDRHRLVALAQSLREEVEALSA